MKSTKPPFRAGPKGTGSDNTVNKYTHHDPQRMDIHQFKDRAKYYAEKIQEDDAVLKDNKKVLQEFFNYLRSDQLSWGAIYKYMWLLSYFAKECDKKFTAMDNKDLQAVLAVFEDYGVNRKWNKTTQNDLRISLKRLFNWINEEYGSSVDVSKIKTRKSKKAKMPEELLTREEVETLIDHCATYRDKAFIHVLYESGTRIGELLGLQLKHIRYDQYGIILSVNGKTGQRRVRLIESVPTLKNYLENHPFKQDMEAPLWLTEKNNRSSDAHYAGLGYRGARKILERLQKRTGIEKKIHPHLFRHTRATELAKHLKEAQLREFFGWAKNSDMPSTYVHLAGRDVDEGLLQMYGMEAKEEDEVTTNLINCVQCNAENSPRMMFCVKCGAYLHDREKEKENKMEEVLVEFLKALAEDNPDIKKKFVKIAKEKDMLDLFTKE